VNSINKIDSVKTCPRAFLSHAVTRSTETLSQQALFAFLIEFHSLPFEKPVAHKLLHFRISLMLSSEVEIYENCLQRAPEWCTSV
jgi:hypothetical protein